MPPRSIAVPPGAILSLACALLLGAASPSAHACSLAPGDFYPPASADGGVPPRLGVPEVLGVSVKRGRGPVCDADGCSFSTCDDIGAVTVELAPREARDPRVGHELALSGGNPPEGMGQFSRLLSASGDALRLHWIDGDADEQEPLDFSVTVTEIDAFGNRGPDSVEVRVLDDGVPDPGPGEGPEDASGGGGLGWAVPLAMLAFGVWRGRRRSHGRLVPAAVGPAQPWASAASARATKVSGS